MNIKNTTIMSVVFAILLSAVPVMGAVTIVNQSEFDTAKSGAEWSGGVKMSTSNGDEVGMDDSGIFSYTVGYEDWKHTSDPLEHEVTTAFISILSVEDEITMTISQGSNSNPSGTPTVGGSIGTITTTYASTSALWIGIFSSESGLIEVPNFDMFNMVSNDQSIPGSISISGSGFAGFKIATNNTIDFSGWLRTSQNGSATTHVGNEARFVAFGDNSLDAIPEPSIPTLVGMIGIFFLLRKRR